MSESKPTSIAELMQQLNRFALPVICDLDKVTRCLKRSNVGPLDVFAVIEHDPVFCLYLQKLAGEKQLKRGGEINGPDHALSMLGLAAVEELVKKLTAFDAEEHPHVRQVLAESVLAAHFTAVLAKLKGGHVQELRSAALFSRVAEWIMYFSHSRRSWQCRRMFYRKPFSSDHISETLFQFTYSDLQQKIAEDFHLPNLNHRLAKFSIAGVAREIITAIRLHRQNDLRLEDCSRSLRLHMGAPEMTPIIANKLAQAACSPWLRTTWNRWLSIAAIHCHHKETEIAAQLVEEMRVCDKSGLVFREFPLASGIINQRSLTPYQRFMTSQSQAKKLAKAKKNALKQSQTVERQLKQEHATAQSNQQTIKQSKPQKNEGLRDSKKAAVKAKPSSPSRLSRTSNKNDAKMDAALANEAKENLTVEYTFEQRDKIKILLKRLKETPHVFKGIKQVISFTLKVLSEECPIERVVFLTLSKDGKELKTGLSQVQKQAEPVPIINGHFEQTVVWKKFLPKPTFLLFDKDKHSKIWPQLPSVIINDHRVDFFLFNSLQYGGKVKAFLYADMALSGKRLPTQLINDFKKVSAGLAFAIRAQAKNNVTKT